VDEVAWKVGYEEPAYFRRLFKRRVGLTPGAYRRKFWLPKYVAEPSARGATTASLIDNNRAL
jgi:AraC-like DNA-binding protein